MPWDKGQLASRHLSKARLNPAEKSVEGNSHGARSRLLLCLAPSLAPKISRAMGSEETGASGRAWDTSGVQL